MVRAVIVADTDLPPRDVWGPLVRKADLVVAADGGANRALAAGIRVDWLVGDLDGALASTLERIPKRRTRLLRDPYSTDLEKAFRFCQDRGVGRVDVIGAIGGRLDHTLGSVAVLVEWGRKMRVAVVDDHFTTTLVRSRTRFRAPIGTLVSLIAPGGAEGVTTTGLRFELKNRRLPFSSLGIHNEVRRNPVEVSHTGGTLILMRAHYVRRHL